MEKKVDLMSLQNGSDVRGIAVAGVTGEDVNLTADAVNRIAAGFAAFLAAKTGKAGSALKIAVGHDSRVSAATMKHGVLSGLAAQGVQPFDCGLASTPAMFMSIVFAETAMDGAVMITASHLPFNRNGLKFFTADGGLEKDEITEVLRRASDLSAGVADTSSVPQLAILDLYAAHLRRLISGALGLDEAAEPLAGMHVVVDAGNGAGGFFATAVLAPLGADIVGSQFLDPDGTFPNHVPNPENKEAMASVSRAVREAQGDLGLIFDTDVDRMSAVLSDGREINRNALIAMMAAILAPLYPGSTIVTDSVTSDELTVFLETHLGLKHHRYMRGYKNVINECRRLNGQGIVSPLAIETSGHGALRENYYLDDGAYLAVKLLVAATQAKRAGSSLDEIIAALKEPAESAEYRLRITTREGVQAYGQEVLRIFAARATAAGITLAEPSYEGVRLVFPKGWALLRMSLHDPNMPLNVESKERGGCALIRRQLRPLLTGLAGLDTEVLQE